MGTSLFDRDDYPTLQTVTYLNQASLGLIGQPAVDAMNQFLEAVGRHGNTYMSDREEAGFLDSLRLKAAQLLESDPEQVAILSSASELLGQMPLILTPDQRRKVVLISTDFPAVTRPWLRLEELGDCDVVFVDDEPDTDLTQELMDRIDADTWVVAVGSVQYATGTVVDIPVLCRATQREGARLVVDATQEVGAMARSVGSWGADVVVASGYKWLGGHGGVAVATMGRALLDESPALPGWMSAPEPFYFEATRLPLARGARRYTQSTISYVSAAGLAAAIDQILQVGLQRIESAALGHARQLVDQVRSLGWDPFRNPDGIGASPHIVSLGRAEMDIDRVMESLRESRVVASGRGGRVRVSLAPYNDTGDLDSISEALGR